MNFKFIKEIACPKCGCDVITEESIDASYSDSSQYRTHANGGRWEVRKFACGQKLSYCPNYSKTETSNVYVCSKNEAYINDQKNKKAAVESVVDFVQQLDDVSDDFKAKIISKLEYLV